jgi:S-DNA-T family DNA segregation ATPase FtsK/SpoIIIE
MASYTTRQRDPLLDSNMQAAIEKRGKELLGIGLVVVGVLAGMMLASYSPEDPNWMLASDAPIENWLGSFGASLAAPLVMIIGWAAWGISASFAVWGGRFALHRGAERALGRVIFIPIAIAFAAVYASTLAPTATWAHSFGLGGLFGDTVLAILLTVLPVQAVIAVKAASLLMGIMTLLAAAFVLGFDKREIKAIGRFLLVGTILLYSLLLRLIGRGASASLRAAQGGVAVVQARRSDSMTVTEAEKQRVAAVVRANPAMPGDRPMSPRLPLVAPARERAEPEKSGGFLGFMPSLRRKPEPLPEAELVTAEPPYYEGAVDGERIRARISDAIRNRATSPEPSRSEPPVTRGPKPLVIDQAAATFAPDDDLDEAVILDDSYEPEPMLARPLFETEAPEARKVVQHTTKRQAAPSRQARAEAQPRLKFDDSPSDYECPPLNLLMNPIEIQRHHLSDEALEENARMLESVLDDYGVKGEIVSVRPGPVVTMYELEPAPGLKASRVIGLSDDIARSMSALSARVSTVPGRSVIGIELPNVNREKVVLREILAARDFGDSNMKLPLALGKDIGGDPVIANLSKMPHLLIAGTTGSGKSVAINTMILSLLYKLTPEECRLIMIDPKMLELSVYDGIPHLLSPVVTDPKKAVVALKWTVGEMEERYRKMSKMGVRNIEGYNSRVADALGKGEMFSRTVQTGFDEETGDPVFETEEFAPEKMPYIVVIVDEMADLMMVAGKEIEACIQRLAQMARASGIHLIMATQRPSVDVITGTIKANFPTRISFQVTSKIDSRTILGEQGAEQLLGMGDMLYMAGGAKITRVHGPFVSDEEVEEIVNFLKGFGPPEYMSGVVDGPAEEKEAELDLVLGLGGNTDGEDALYDQAVAIVIKDRKCSTSYIQRKLAIGYNKAARLVEQMEDVGVISSANHVGKREILVPEQH